MSRRKPISADDALKLIGDDPQTLVLAIQLMDRMLARRKRSQPGNTAG